MRACTTRPKFELEQVVTRINTGEQGKILAMNWNEAAETWFYMVGFNGSLWTHTDVFSGITMLHGLTVPEEVLC